MHAFAWMRGIPPCAAYVYCLLVTCRVRSSAWRAHMATMAFQTGCMHSQPAIALWLLCWCPVWCLVWLFWWCCWHSPDLQPILRQGRVGLARCVRIQAWPDGGTWWYQEASGNQSHIRVPVCVMFSLFICWLWVDHTYAWFLCEFYVWW